MPAIPEPLFVGFHRKQCHCGEKFNKRIDYEKHYVYTHVWAGL